MQSSFGTFERAGPASTRGRTGLGVALPVLVGLIVATVIAACDNDRSTAPPGPQPLDPALVAAGKEIFRFNTFGDEPYWTDTLRMHEVVQKGVSPATALSVGLKVDVDTLPAAVRSALAAGQVDLNSPATTVTLLKLGAVVGLKGTVATVNGKDTRTRL